MGNYWVLPAVDRPHRAHGDDSWTVVYHRLIISVIAQHGQYRPYHYVDVGDENGRFLVDQLINVGVG